MRDAVFESFDSTGRGWDISFSHPRAVYEAATHGEVLSVLLAAEKAAKEGSWAVVLLSYEAAPAFDPALEAHGSAGFPLACLAIFDAPSPKPAARRRAPYRASVWEPQVERRTYTAAIGRIRDYIASGDTYQVNYTFPMECGFEGDVQSWYEDLCASQGAGYSAYIDLGRYKVLSLSPELFFERQANRLIARPMKGTMPRGRWAAEDEQRAGELAGSSKNRAENLMIVDLLRNDLGRIAAPGSVRVTKIFEVERYETLWQMTSTIESVCMPGTGLAQIFAALFPCGSITGAPKIRTMQIIRELEPHPRSLYTGTIGFLRPGGDCVFNVAIRTILLDTKTGRARFGVGGGITYDSTAESEYEECLLKARFLGRGQSTFRLLETILLDDGSYSLLDRHIERMLSSANYFGFTLRRESLEISLASLQASHPIGRWRVRLLAARDGSISTEISALKPEFERVRRVALAGRPVDSANLYLFHKTTDRALYDEARQLRPDCDDVILWNERGEVTESTLANLVLAAGERKWTPPLASGLLPGTLRAELLARGELRERVIHKDELMRGDSIFLINSVQGWVRATLAE